MKFFSNVFPRKSWPTILRSVRSHSNIQRLNREVASITTTVFVIFTLPRKVLWREFHGILFGSSFINSFHSTKWLFNCFRCFCSQIYKCWRKQQPWFEGLCFFLIFDHDLNSKCVFVISQQSKGTFALRYHRVKLQRVGKRWVHQLQWNTDVH